MLKQASFGLAVLTVVGLVLGAGAFAQDISAKPKSLADDPSVGNWSLEGTLDGKAVKGSMRVRPSAGGMCLILNWSYGSTQNDLVRGTAVEGLDLAKNQLVGYMFESDGSHFFDRYPNAPSLDSGTISGERTGVIHGKPYKGKITLERKGRDQTIFTVVSDRGEDVKLVFKRIQGERSRRQR